AGGVAWGPFIQRSSRALTQSWPGRCWQPVPMWEWCVDGAGVRLVLETRRQFPMTIRPRRSVLYMPGSNARAFEKAKTLPVDGVILDLEDSVAPEAKEAAREQVASAVKAGGFGVREVFIRVNGVDSPWHADDLSAAARAAPDIILVPKVSSPDTLELIGRRLLDMGTDHKTRV